MWRGAKWNVAIAGALACMTAAAAGQVAVRGKTVHTMAGPPITDGVVVILDGKVAAVGPAAQVRIPEGFRVLEAAVVTPGLIDAHGTVGLSGLFNHTHDQDQLESSSPIQPELRAVDAYNPQDRLIEFIRSFGVTTVHTGHGPGELMSGQTMIVKTRGDTVEEASVVDAAAVAATLSPSAQKSGKAPGTRGKMMSMLREELIKAQEYERKRQRAVENNERKEADAAAPGEAENGDAKEKLPPDRNLRLETLGRVLSGALPLLVTAHRAQDIASVLRLAEEFGIRVILDGASEAYLLSEQLKAANIPVIVHPTMMRAYGEAENASFETPAHLRHKGIRIALQSGYEGYVPKTRVVLHEAAMAAANGLTFEEALAAVTIDAARILGIDSRVGSLEVGKDGDVALYDGDPFEYTSHCVGVVIEGEVVSEEVR